MRVYISCLIQRTLTQTKSKYCVLKLIDLIWASCCRTIIVKMSSCDAIFFDLIWPDMTWGVMMWKTWFENGHRIQRVRLPMINRFYDVLGCFLPSWTNMMCILLITTWYPRKYIDFPRSMRKSCNTSKSYKIHFCQLKCTAACQNAYSDQVFASLSMLYLQICTAVAFCICICTTSLVVFEDVHLRTRMLHSFCETLHRRL